MKGTASMTRVLMALALAGFAVPAWAQHQNENQVIGMPGERFVDATNKGDGKAAVDLFTSDGFNIDDYGKNSGTRLEEEVRKIHDMGGTITMKPDSVMTLAGGRVVIVTGTFVVNYTNNPTTKTAGGTFMRVLVKEGPDWKIAAQDISAGPPQATK